MVRKEEELPFNEASQGYAWSLYSDLPKICTALPVYYSSWYPRCQSSIPFRPGPCFSLLNPASDRNFLYQKRLAALLSWDPESQRNFKFRSFRTADIKT